MGGPLIVKFFFRGLVRRGSELVFVRANSYCVRTFAFAGDDWSIFSKDGIKV